MWSAYKKDLSLFIIFSVGWMDGRLGSYAALCVVCCVFLVFGFSQPVVCYAFYVVCCVFVLCVLSFLFRFLC